MIPLPRLLATLLLLLPFSGTAGAFEPPGSPFSIHGFGTFGLVHSDTDDAEFIRDIGQPDGPDGGWSADVDSRMGLQMGYRISRELDATVQAVSRYDHEGSYEPDITWAFLRYQPSADLQLRLGRVGLDAYMLSDSRDVGYSYLWVRPPVDHYGLRHFTRIDGGDAAITRPVGAGLAWLKLYAGMADEPIAMSDGIVMDSDGTAVYGAHVNYEAGPWHLRLDYSKYDFELEPTGTFQQNIQTIAPIFPQVVDNLLRTLNNFDMQMVTAGVVYNRGPLQIQAMGAHLDFSAVHDDMESAFVTVGYRLGRVTPYVTLSRVSSDGIEYEALGLQTGGDLGTEQETLSIGARYDVNANIALKAQLDHVRVEESDLLWRNEADGWSGDVNVFSLALDFVF